MQSIPTRSIEFSSNSSTVLATYTFVNRHFPISTSLLETTIRRQRFFKPPTLKSPSSAATNLYRSYIWSRFLNSYWSQLPSSEKWNVSSNLRRSIQSRIECHPNSSTVEATYINSLIVIAVSIDDVTHWKNKNAIAAHEMRTRRPFHLGVSRMPR